MSIYKGLLFLDGFRIPAEYVDDAKPAVHAVGPSRKAPRKRTVAGPLRRTLHAWAAAAGVVAPTGPVGRCG